MYGQAWKGLSFSAGIEGLSFSAGIEGLSFSAGIEGLSFSVLVLPAFVLVCMGRHGRDCHLVQA